MSNRMMADRAAYGAPCAQCGATLAAPVWSEEVNDWQVRHLWTCDDCDYSYESLVCYPKVHADTPNLRGSK